MWAREYHVATYSLLLLLSASEQRIYYFYCRRVLSQCSTQCSMFTVLCSLCTEGPGHARTLYCTKKVVVLFGTRWNSHFVFMSLHSVPSTTPLLLLLLFLPVAAIEILFLNRTTDITLYNESSSCRCCYRGCFCFCCWLLPMHTFSLSVPSRPPQCHLLYAQTF